MIPESILSFFHASKSWPIRSMTYFNFLLEATLAGSILILVVLVLRRVFRRKIGSRMVYLAWALVAIRLLVPIAIPNPLMDEFRPTMSTDAGARPVADQFRVRVQDAMFDVSYAFSETAEESDSQFVKGLSGVLDDIETYTSYGWLGKGFLMLYIAGGLVVLGVFMTRHLRFRRQLRKAAVGPLEGEQLALYRELCARMKVKQLPVVLVVLTVAAFSTAESTEQTRRLNTDPSAFPFSANDTYPEIEADFGEPVALTPLTNAAEAEAQAKRYISALFRESQEDMARDIYRVNAFGDSNWEVVIYPPEGGDRPRYYMELRSGGGLVSVYRRDAYTEEEVAPNTPSELPTNLKDVMASYAQQAFDVAFQWLPVNGIGIRGDFDTPEGRFVSFELERLTKPSEAW